MDKIKGIFGKIFSFVKKNPKEFLALGVFVVALSIYLITNAFAILTPTKSVIITSEKTSYEENVPGSWQVEKSGKWISKGRARVTFDVNTTLMTEDKDTDIIFVLDISGSMSGDKLTKVKEDSTELIELLLSNKNNSAALITFDTGSTIVSNFTNDKDYLINGINNLEVTGNTNYYQPLVNVDNILKDYVKSDNKEVIVLFLTDGYPNVDTPNQIAQYETLKKTYPYITINGIQYEMGDTILNPIREISDNQFHADMETLNNVLFDASVAPIPYDEFKIVDYIDNRYFTLESEDDITVSEGSVKLEEENGKQKITWTIPYFKSGRDAKLSMDIVLKDEYIGQGGIYPTNESEEIISSIQGQKEDVTSTLTPVLADNYQVIYDGNAPDGCTVNNVPDSLSYSVFDTVSITEEQPSCAGYQFKGWEVVNKDVTRVGEDYFIMPEENVIICAKWAKVTIAKSMDGTVNKLGDPIMKRYTRSTSTDYHSGTYKSKVTSIVTKDNLEIPSTAIEYWDVSAAGDGSVIAYVEDDGSGNGTYKVTIGGQGGIIANSDSSYLFSGYSNDRFSSLESIDLTYLDTSQVTNMSSMFEYCSGLANIIFGDSFDTSNVTNMSSMFSGCSGLTSLDVSKFDTSNVTNMSGMFSGCSSLTNIIFGDSLDTSKVTDMNSMFRYCESLTSLDVSNFNTSNVTTMNSMFESCSSLTSLDVSNFDTSSVTNMQYMFSGCSGLTNLDVSNFNTSNVTDMRSMFSGCSSLTNLDVSHFDTSKVTGMSWMFSNCSSLTHLDISSFDTSNVTNMGYMFYRCSSLTNLDVSNFDTSNVTYMSNLFSSCRSLTSLDLSNFDTSKVTDMSSMFYDLRLLTSLDVSNFDTSNVTNMSSMFYSSSSLTDLDVSNFDTSKVTSMYKMFSSCSSLTSLDLSNFDTSKVTSMYWMFVQCSSLINIVFGDNFDTSKVTDMNNMFSSCSSLINLDVSNFNTSNVTDMSDMFAGCSSLINLDVSNFNTSNVTDMSYMFYGCSSLTGLDVSNFDTSKVTNMTAMFSGCSSLKELDLSSFDTSNVTNMTAMFGKGVYSGSQANTDLKIILFGEGWDTSKVTDMSYMFDGCSGLTNLDVSNFDTSKVTNMSSMFYDCSSLTSLDVSHFDTSNVTDMSSMFDGCSSLTSLDVSHFDTSKVTSMSYMFYDCSRLTSLDMRNADFSSVTTYGNMFGYVNSNINVIVKDSMAQSFVRAGLDDYNLSNATVTIANVVSQTSLFEIGPREFGPFVLL